MNIVVVGTGYVGLVTGACFAEMGNTVICVDVDKAKIEGLKHGKLPIYEPGLDDLVTQNYEEGRLRFTTSLPEAMVDANVFFIAVGTPPGEDGSADLQYVLAVARELGQHTQNPYNVVVDKSTVPVGTADKVTAAITEELARRGSPVEFDVVSNPEFLKEGAAIDDFMHPDRVVVGSNDERATRIMRELYAPFTRNHERTVVMGVRDAEMTKYAANAMLATKISFMNEIANLCEVLGVDVENVRKGIGSDSRIGYHFIYPGCGYGGSCFPKDVKALVHTAEQNDFEPWLLRAVEKRNDNQKFRLSQKVFARFGQDLTGLTFALWGLAFKPGTDDMREAPSKVFLREVIASGAKVVAFDPVAAEVAEKELARDWFENGHLTLVEHQYQALDGVDALVLATEWMPFRNPDFAQMKSRMKQPIIVDGRNQYEPATVKALGFEYTGIGR